jgi:hypothetical protein
MLVKKFHLFESSENVDISYNPEFVKKWNDVLFYYNNFENVVNVDFFERIENDLQILSSTAYSIQTIRSFDNLTKEERKVAMSAKSLVLGELEEISEKFRKTKDLVYKSKLSPSKALLLNGESDINDNVYLKKMVYSPEYNILKKYLEEIWNKYSKLEHIYSEFIKNVEQEVIKNNIDMFTTVQNLIQDKVEIMKGKKIDSLPILK